MFQTREQLQPVSSSEMMVIDNSFAHYHQLCKKVVREHQATTTFAPSLKIAEQTIEQIAKSVKVVALNKNMGTRGEILRTTAAIMKHTKAPVVFFHTEDNKMEDDVFDGLTCMSMQKAGRYSQSVFNCQF